MKYFISFITLLFMSSGAFAASGSQVDFKLGNLGRSVVYNYKWLDYEHKPQKLSFKLNKSMVRKASHEFHPFDNDAANNFVYSTVKTYAANLATKGIAMTVREDKVSGKVEIAAKGSSQAGLQQEMSQVNKLIETSRTKYIHDNFFRLYDAHSVVPDHVRIASVNYRRMRPVASAIAKQTPSNLRKRINHTLGFLQSIPYDELMSRSNSNGSGFAPPVELLTRNRADCDSKSVAFASIMRNMYPQVPMVLVLVPGHAFIGVAMTRREDDFALKIAGRVYVLAEPVGPAMMPLGELSKRSEDLLRKGEYTYVKFR